jgi:hypothetical protein
MSHRCKVYLSANLVTKSFKCFSINLCSIVNCNGHRHTETANDVLPKELLTVAEVIVATGLASIHFEKYSTATTTYLRFPCAGGSGPSKSKPHLCSGQVG